MGRLFLKLYSVIALAGIVFFVGVANLDKIIHGTLQYHYGKLAQGSYTLLEQNLHNIPENKWPLFLEEINQGGGYPVKVLPLDTLEFPPSKMEQLEQGVTVISKVYEAMYSYKRIGQSQWVFEVPFEQSGYQHVQRLISSTFNLIEKRLTEQPPERWPETLAAMNLQFDFPIALIEQHQDEFLAGESQRLSHQEVIVNKLEDKREFFYRQISNSSQILKLGSFKEPVTLNYLQAILMLAFSVLVALAVLLWVYPLWRDLKHLRRRTELFGEGDFSVRAPLATGSVLYKLAETFNGMADRIQGLISSHKELTNAVSHELRTPIARLRFGMEMLQTSSKESDRTRFINSMNADIDELDQLVAELLTYARFDRDKPALTFQNQTIYSWLEEVIEQANIGKERLDIGFEVLGNELEQARFEPQLLARALGNLLQNAKRYALNEIKVSFFEEDGYFKLSVDDDGEGIPESERESIFDAFKRLDASRDRETGGYGLGLAIAQRISEWHGGNIEVEDSPLGGARFVIQWPAKSCTE